MSLATNISDLATRIATECKAIRTLVNGNAADLTALTTTSKTSIVSALNELKSSIDSIAGSVGATINDSASSSTSQTWSITKIQSTITAALNALTSGAPTALDTLDELAAALGDDANFASTITTALGNRLRFDAAQTLTGPQQTQGLANLGAQKATDVGDTTTNFVTAFTNGLA